MRNRLGKYLVECANRDPKLVLLSGDIGFGIFDDFIKGHPDKFINCGIAEQNMIGTAAGLSNNGFHVIVYTIIPFLVYRPFDFIRNLIAHQGLPVCLIGVGGGYAYDSLGFTHYSKEDLALIGSLPNFKIYTPHDPDSAETCFKAAMRFESPSYIRLMKGGELNLLPMKNDEGYSILSHYGGDYTVLTYGSIAAEVIESAKMLSEDHGILGTVVSIWDIDSCTDVYEKSKGIIFIIEEHNPPGILASRIIEKLKRMPGNIEFITLERNALHTVAKRKDILAQQGLSVSDITRRIKETLQKELGK